MDTIARARELQKQHGVSAGTALHWARNEQTVERVPMEETDLGFEGHIEKDGFVLRVKWELDETDDLSWLGTFKNQHEDGAVQNPRWRPGSGYYRWFVPTNTYEDHVRGLHELGYSRGVADQLARQYVREDVKFAISEEHGVYVCSVTAWRKEVELASVSLGGVDLGTDYKQALEWAETLPDDNGLLAEAVSEAATKLGELCGGTQR